MRQYSTNTWMEQAEQRKKLEKRRRRWGSIGLCGLYFLAGAAAMFAAVIYYPMPWW